MELYPAIDLKDGQCVRLRQGVFDSVHKVANDPVAVAEDYREAGASVIHVVDLDGARDGVRKNAALLSAIVRVAAPTHIELGGGLRTMKDLESADRLGVWRFVIGSAAVTDPEFVQAAAQRYGSRIAVGVDARDGLVRTHGWERETGLSEIDFALQMTKLGVKTIIYTDIATDGAMEGPSLEHIEAMRAALPPEVALVASGGVSHLKHVTALRKTGVSAAIVGLALYEGTLSLTEALSESRLGAIFDKNDLVPAIIQSHRGGEVLMLGYMNRQSLEETLRTKRATFWSRSRDKLWVKGETSGHFLHVVSVHVDCDQDALLLRCRPHGPTCHTGNRSCFFSRLWEED